MKIAVPDVISNSYFPAAAAVELGFFKQEGLDVSLELIFPVDQAYAARHPEVQPGRYVMLAVSDTGVGMDAETQSHIFEPFFTTKGLGKGTGLGLATVLGVVQQSGGSVAVYSELGHGTTLKMYLPCVEEAVETVDASQVSAVFLRGSETILLAEDEDGVRDLTREILQMHGYVVLEARNAIEALAVAEQHAEPIHLLVTDVVMPQMSGRELADRLMPLRTEMRVLFMSGYLDSTLASVAHVYGEHGRVELLGPGTHLLRKPFTKDQLANAVEQALAFQ